MIPDWRCCNTSLSAATQCCSDDSVPTASTFTDMSDLAATWHAVDRAVSKRVFSLLVQLGYPEAGRPAHPLTRGRWLVDTPTPLLASLLLYTVIVSLGCVVLTSRKRRQPSKQRKADPKWLQYGVQLHNIFLILLSLWMSTTSLYCAYKYNYRFFGQAVSTKEGDLGYVAYIFYVSKIYEFMDTVGHTVTPQYEPCHMRILRSITHQQTVS